MAKMIKKKIKVEKPASKPPLELVPSELKVFDVPLDYLHGDKDNPNEMSESKFDELCEGIRTDGFDEPIQVIPHPDYPNEYLIAGGHHRVKAARKVGLTVAPTVIKEGWDKDQQEIALVRRNILHGDLNGAKFTRLWEKLAQKYDPKLLQSMMGFTKKKEFDSVYEGVARSLQPKQRKQLEKAKESIKSVDDLSSVLNTIFKKGGSEMQKGYLVFSFGGKNHHYVQVDKETDKKLTELKERADKAGIDFAPFLQSIIMGANIGNATAVAPKKSKVIRKRK